MVYASDIEGLTDLIMKERNLVSSNTVAQVGLDDGQGLFKVMLSLKASEQEIKVTPNKKAKYCDGFSPNDFRLSGSKKLILLLVSPTTEHYDNLTTLLGLLNIDAIEFGFSCDLKMVLLLLGKQAASSKHCCPFCTGCSPWLSASSSNTIGSQWTDYTRPECNK